MWIQMKTFDTMGDEDIYKIFTNQKIKPLNNVFEVTRKNMKCIKKQNQIGMDLIAFQANMIQMTSQKNKSSLSRGNSNNYIVYCANIKDENGEFFSSLVDTSNESDRFIFINVIVQNLSNSICFNNKKIIISIRPENNSLVFFLKHRRLLKKKMNLFVTNLSQITSSGTYSLFGWVIKIIKYSDEDYMLLRLQCNDKSCVKIRKYSHSVQEFTKISRVENISEVKYDFSSNKVDILIKNPCIEFYSLIPKQRISLNNVIVKYSNDLDLYSLHVEGLTKNLKADPIETRGINSLRPPTKQFPIPNELKPSIQRKKDQILSTDVQLASKNITYQKFRTLFSPPKKLKLSTKQSQNCQAKLTDSSSDDIVNVSPCRDFSPPHRICSNKNKKLKLSTKPSQHYQMKLRNSSSEDDITLSPCRKFLSSKRFCNEDKTVNLVSNKNENNGGRLLIKKTILESQTDNQIQNNSGSLPIVQLNEESSSIKKKDCSTRENSPDWSTDESCSPPFFKTSEIFTSNIKPQSKTEHLNNIYKSTQCIGPCRLVYFEPHVYDSVDIVHGYCIKCCAFIPKSLLNFFDPNHLCPECFNIVQLTFFFKMTFLYGKQENQAIEICCFNEKAERVIKKLTKKTINVESYLLNNDYKKLITDTFQSIVYNKTKVNIVICKSPNDNTNVLLSIDTKYVVTTPID